MSIFFILYLSLNSFNNIKSVKRQHRIRTTISLIWNGLFFPVDALQFYGSKANKKIGKLFKKQIDNSRYI